MINGMGPWFYVDRSNTVVCCQKEGINAGVSAVVRHFAAQDVNMVILTNMEDGGWEPVWRIHEMVVSGEFDAGPK